MAAAEEALRALDGRAAGALLLALASRGEPLPGDLVGRSLGVLPDIGAVPPLVGASGGDRVAMLLHAASSGRLSDERLALSLALAVLLAPHPSPEDLARQLRLAAREPMGSEARFVLAAAAQWLGDDEVVEVVGALPADAGPAVAVLRGSFEGALSEPIAKQLPERDREKRDRGGFTVRRAAAKVGRNEPCPCGSGKKYKRCCEARDRERLADPSPVAGVTRQEYLSNAHRYMSPVEFSRLRPTELAALDLGELDATQLAIASRTFALYRYWERAEAAIERLAKLEGDPEAAGHREDLIREALTAGERDLARRHLEKLGGQPPELRVAASLLEPTEATIDVLEEEAERGLRDQGFSALFELAFALLEQRPALGILVARGVLDPGRLLDSDTLLEQIERSRDRLDLPPGDPALEVFDLLMGEDADRRAREHEDAQIADEIAALRDQLRDQSARARALERELSQAQEALSAADERALQDERALERQPPEPREPIDATELERLRIKVSHLKGLLTESHTDRRDLRARLANIRPQPGDPGVARQLDSTRPGRDSASVPEAPAVEDDRTTHRPRIPVFSATARRALDALPARVAADAIRLVAQIAAGSSPRSAAVKRLKGVDDVCSARVGLHHRLLFHRRSGSRELECIEVVTREDLDAAIRRLRRG